MVCITIILTMVFFSVRVPFSENDKLHARIKVIEKEREFSEKFTRKMIDVSRMLDTINRTTPQESEILEGRIEEQISSLRSMVADTTYNKDLYLNVVHNLSDIKHYSKKLRKETDKDNEAESYKIQLQKAQEKANETYAKYLECLKKLSD